MTPLERALRERIQAEGPVTVETFMSACNEHYYATRDPLGRRGDFTTAPEVSQMFGEIVGAALADCWARAGSPPNAAYAELGPGRGTLASDALRVMRAAGFGGDVHCVETSPVLRSVQESALPGSIWHDTVETLPRQPLLIVANEFFDALPIRQHVGASERRITIDADALTFDRDGEITETSPARDAVVATISKRLAERGGAALIIDYGHARTAPGDTLQAVRGHCYSPVLADPGEQDLTSHVDFEALACSARANGASVTELDTQGRWLRKLGIDKRAASLSRVNPERAGEIAGALERLTGRDQMGDLFKVIGIHAPSWPAPPGLA